MLLNCALKDKLILNRGHFAATCILLSRSVYLAFSFFSVLVLNQYLKWQVCSVSLNVKCEVCIVKCELHEVIALQFSKVEVRQCGADGKRVFGLFWRKKAPLCKTKDVLM